MRQLSASNYKDNLIFKWIHLTLVSFTSVLSQSWQKHASALGHRQMSHCKNEKQFFLCSDVTYITYITSQKWGKSMF